MNQYTFEIQKPVVQTKFGQLRGVTYGDVNIFMGIPYARAKRFHMPEEPQAWTGIKNAYTYGPITPQMLPPNPPPYYRGLHMLQKQGEDCQNLNIWAPKSLAKKSPFLFGCMAAVTLPETHWKSILLTASIWHITEM